MITQAAFMLLCHGRVGTASLLEALQEVDEVFVPSYWHTDELLERGSLDCLLDRDTRLSAQRTLPAFLDDVRLGLINHNFPTQRCHAERIGRNLHTVLEKGAPVFIWTRDPLENILSSYRTYLEVYFIFNHCEGNENARGIYSAFNTPAPLGLAAFIDRHSYIVDYPSQVEVYSRAGYRVNLRPYDTLRTNLQGEIETVLATTGIPCRPFRVPQLAYPRGEKWAVQVSFAFRNTRSIDGFPLAVGYFDPPRGFPNQGALTLELRDKLFVAPDQWFRLPHTYRKRILAMTDPWRVLASTKDDYIAFEQRIERAVQLKLDEEEASDMTDTARRRLNAAGIATEPGCRASGASL